MPNQPPPWSDSRTVTIGSTITDSGIGIDSETIGYWFDKNGDGQMGAENIEVFSYGQGEDGGVVEAAVDVAYDVDGLLGFQFWATDLWGSTDSSGVFYVKIDATVPANELVMIPPDQTDITESSINIYWYDPDDNPDENFVSYQIYYSNYPTVDENDNLWDNSDDESLNTILNQYTTISGLHPNTNYFFTVTTVDSALNIGPLSNVIGPVKTGFANNAAYALEFTGNDESYVDLGSDQILHPDSYTISMWVKVNGNSAGNLHAGFVSRLGTADSGDYGYLLAITFSDPGYEDHILFSTQDNSGNHYHTYSDNSIEFGSWYHVTATYDGEMAKLYINGVAQGMGMDIPDLNNNNEFNTIIGKWRHDPLVNSNYSLDGSIDEVTIWDQALSQESIQANMFVPVNGNEESLVGYWNFNEGEGSTVYDLSENDFDGIINGATEWVDADWHNFPATPQNLTSESFIENVTLTWDLGSEANLEKYFIYRGTAPGASTLLDSVNVPEWYNPDSRGEPEPISYIDLSTDQGTTYYYRVTALNSENFESTSSLEVSGASGFGCMDPIASNYNPAATFDDGLCEYDGDYSLDIPVYAYGEIETAAFDSDLTGSLTFYAKIHSAGTHYLFTGGKVQEGLAFIVDTNVGSVGIQQLYAYSAPSQSFTDDIININQWHHFTFVSNGIGTPYEVYVNGVKLNNGAIIDPDQSYLEGAWFGNVGGNSSAWIGKARDGSLYLNGTVDDIQVWNRPLSQEEIQLNMLADQSGNEEGLITYYSFDDGTGSEAVDLTGNSTNVLLFGGATFTDDHIISGCTDSLANNYDVINNFDDGSCVYPDYSIYFNGTDEYVNCGSDASLDIENDITVSAYIKTTTNTSSVIISKYNGSAYAGWLIGVNIEGYAYFSGRSGGGQNDYHSVASTTIINDDKWHHVVGKRVNSDWSIIVDGYSIIETKENYGNGSFVNNNPLTFGKNFEGDDWHYNGHLDNVGIWDRALTDEEIASITHGNFDASSISDLVGYWDFDGNVEDLSGNENHGELNGTSWSLNNMIPGCTDPLAENYNDGGVTLNDGSCEYYDNYALEFTGIDEDYVIFDDNESLNLNNDFTFSAFLKSTAENGHDLTIIDSYGGNPARGWALINQDHRYIEGGEEGGEYFVFVGRTADNEFNGIFHPIAINDDKWHYVTIKREDSVWSIIVDGIKNSASFPGTEGDFANNHPLIFGINYEVIGPGNPAVGYNGLMDNIGLWNRALSDEEISSNMYDGVDFNNYDESLMGYWAFNDVLLGNQLLDLSANGNDGDITGAEWTIDVPISGCNDPSANNYNPESNTAINCSYGDISTEYYVSNTGNDEYYDGSEAFPFKTIQYALDMAENDYTIHVASGTYNENIEWPIYTSGIKLLGAGIDSSIIDGGDNGRVININGYNPPDVPVNDQLVGSDTEISGFTIQNGYSDVGGGIYILWEHPTLSNLDIRNNEVSGSGGGLYIGSSGSLISNVIVRDNEAQEGGGIATGSTLDDGEGVATLDNVIITGNTATGEGGGLNFSYGELAINNTEISKNESGDHGGGIRAYSNGGSLQLDGVTIADNIAGNGGAGIHLESDSENFVTTITNSIIVNNTGESQLNLGDNVVIDISYSNITDGLGVGIIWEYMGGFFYENNIDVDPRFRDSENGNYNLFASSLCINAGSPESTDADGTRRDMGAYPYLVDYDGSNGWYVSTSGSDSTGMGSSILKFASIQAALNFAYENQTVHVASGLYNENIEWPIYTSGIKLLGAGIDNSIIDGGGIGRVINIDGFSNGINEQLVGHDTEISGFTIQNGSSDEGGGIYINWEHPTLSNLDIRNNEVSGSGGGLYVGWSGSLISNVIVRDNEAQEGGGIATGSTLDDGEGVATLDNVIITGNTATGEGGGLNFSYGELAINNTEISKNESGDHGGGIRAHSNSGSLQLDGVTIADNIAGNGGGGIHLESDSDDFVTSITNSIIVNNAGESQLNLGGNVVIDISYSNITDGLGVGVIWEYMGGFFYENNIDVAPEFVDPEDGNYNLESTSHCIDAGTADIDGDGVDDITDYNGYAPDMGAYESDYTAIIGCMDPLAPNFNSEAWVDDGSCNYEGSNYALDFDGVDDYVQIDNYTSNFTPGDNDFTVMVWIRAPELLIENEYEQGVVTWYRCGAGVNDICPNPSNAAFAINITTNNEISWWIRGNAQADGEAWLETYSSTEFLEDGLWHQIVGTYSRGESIAKLFIDGVEVDSDNSTVLSLITDDGLPIPLSFGRTYKSQQFIDYTESEIDNYFSGSMDNIQIWSQALTQEEIQQNAFSPDDGLGDENLIGYWDFNNPPGNILVDNSSYGNDGNINGAGWTDEVPEPVFGCTDPIATNYDTEATFDYGCEYNSNYSLEFDGIDDYVVLNTAIDDNLGSGATFSAWVKIEEPASDGALTILSNYASGGPGDENTPNSEGYFGADGFVLTILESGEIGFGYQTSGANRISILSDQIISEGEFFHIAGTWDGTFSDSGFNLYVNGQEVNTYSNGTEGGVDEYVESMHPMEIGRVLNSTGYLAHFSGIIDHVQVYDRALSQYEIPEYLMLSHVGGIIENENLVGFWGFDHDGAGDQLIDLSDNGNHGLVSGATWSNNAPAPVFGCIDSLATNYDPDASVYDYSCEYTELGDYALLFDGQDDVVETVIPETYNWDYTQPFTMSAEIRANSFDTDYLRSFVLNKTPGAIECGNLAFGLSIWSDGTPRFEYMENCNADNYAIGQTPLELDTWYVLTAVYDGSVLKLFRDGIIDGQTTRTLTTTAIENDEFFIGLRGDPNVQEGHDGYIRNAGLWNRALDDVEVANLAAGTYDIDDENLIADWRINAGSGDKIFDHRGNQHHGDIVGADWAEYLTGCIDPLADNYDPDAIVYDFSCTYADNGEHYLVFDGDDDYIEVDHHSELDMNLNVWTIDAWIYPTAYTPGGNRNTIISKKGCGGGGDWINQDGWDFTISSSEAAAGPIDSTLHFSMLEGGGSSDPAYVQGYGSIPIELNKWQHVIVSANPISHDIIFYVNGVQDVTFYSNHGNLQNPIYVDLPLSIGHMYCDYVDPSDPIFWPFIGSIADVAIHNSFIDSEEDAQLLMDGLLPGGFEENVVADWKLNTGSGLTAVDHSTNRHHGEILGSEEQWVYRIDGCMDSLAVNYIPEATDDDGSCIYEVPDNAIVINELMIKPLMSDNPADATMEYIELYNDSDDAINLDNWSFINENNIAISLDSEGLVSYPGDYILLARSGYAQLDDGLEADYVYSGTTLIPNNTFDAIILKDSQGNTMDSVYYSVEGGFPIEEAAGISLELIRPEYDNSNSYSWGLSVKELISGNFGTPGEENSTIENQPTAVSGGPYEVTDFDGNNLQLVSLDGSGSSDNDDIELAEWNWRNVEGEMIATGELSSVELPVGDHMLILEVVDSDNIWGRDTTLVTVLPRVPIVVINEVMKDCGTIVLDTEGEYIEFINLDNEDVDISGWRFVSSSGEYVVGDNVLINGASFYLAGRSSDSYYESDLVYENILLDNTSDFIEIYTSLDQLVDAFYYDGNAPLSSAISLELTDPLLDNESGDSNWFPSTLDIFNQLGDFTGLYGTPGSANSQVSDYGDPFTNEYSLQFDGVDDYVNIGPSDNIDALDEITISAWIKTSDISKGAIFSDYEYHPGNQPDPIENIGWHLAKHDSGIFKFYLSSDGSDDNRTILDGQTIYQTSIWYHIAATYDGNIMKLYVNGNEDGSIEHTGGIYETENLDVLIGGNSGFEHSGFEYDGFEGLIDEVSLWNRALSQEEILSKMIASQQLIPDNEEGLLGYWPFDEGNDSERENFAYDVSGNNHHGTIYGATHIPETPLTVYGCTDPLAENYDPDLGANVDNGCGNDSGTCCTYIPLVPTNVTALGGSHQITISWDHPSTSTSRSRDNETMFTLYRSIDASENSWIELISGLTESEYVDIGLENLAYYCYAVEASNENGSLGISESACAITNSCSGQPGADCTTADNCALLDECQKCTGGDTDLIAGYLQDLCGECTNLISEEEINSCVGCTDTFAANYSSSYSLDCDDCVDAVYGGNCEDPLICDCDYTNNYIVNANNPEAEDCDQCGTEGFPPLLTIQAAINRAHDGNYIYVYPGTYTPIKVDVNVKILSMPDLGDAAISQTVISGIGFSDTSSVIFSGVSSLAELKGFTITGGSASQGAGIHLINSSPVLEKLVIYDNNTAITGGLGGGIYCINSSPIINKVTIADNFGTVGGGIYINDQSIPTIINSIIWNNAPTDAQQIVFPANSGSNMGLILSYSDIQNSSAGWVFNNATEYFIDQGSILDTDPLFIENYYLSQESPCIDVGSPDYLDGDGSIPEMGAYSFEHTLGCTDSNACPGSYDPDATYNDGSCEYDECMSTWWVDDDSDNAETPCGYDIIDDECKTIQAAITMASAGDTVMVAPGTYYENLIINKPLKIFSYFVTSDTVQIDDTIIDGSHSAPGSAGQSVLFFNYTSTTGNRSFNESQLEGFQITGGTGTRVRERCYDEEDNIKYEEDKYVGSAIFILNNNPTINNNIIINNGKNGEDGSNITNEGALMAIDDDDVEYRSTRRDDDVLVIYDGCNASGESIDAKIMDMSGNVFKDNYARHGKSVVIEDNEGTTQVNFNNSDFDVFSESHNTVSNYWVSGNENVEFDYTDCEGDEDFIYDSEITLDARSGGLDSLLGKVLGSLESPITIHLPARGRDFNDYNVYNQHSPLQMVNHVSIKGGGSTETAIADTSDDGKNTQLLIFKNVVGANVESLTLMRGSSKYGGASYIRQSSPKFTDVTFKDNTAERGGGAVFIMGGAPEFIRSTFEDNNSSERGGGIYINASNPIIRESVIKNNEIQGGTSTVYGGGIYAVNSNITFENDSLYNNKAVGYNTLGGAVYIDNTHILDLNRPDEENRQNSFVIEGLILNGNLADFGAGIYIKNAEAEIRRCQITGNVGETGAALYFVDSKVRVINSTISGNSSTSPNLPAGGLYSSDETGKGLFILNTIIWNNSYPQMEFDETHLIVAYSDIGHPNFPNDNLDNYFNVTINPGLDALVLLTNKSIDPLFVAPIAPSGIATNDGNYNLQTIEDGYEANSPCINTGSAVFEWEGEGDLIHLIESEYDGPAPDMGMYESGSLDLIDCMDDGLQEWSPYTGTEACNYEPNATSQCTDCCEYPAPFHTCSGDCIVDANENGICDEEEVEGCMDDGLQEWSPYPGTEACNYSQTATSDNGSCLYTVDCFGVCGGIAEVDACGVCDGLGDVYECGCVGIVDGECDCEGNVEDECGVCGGEGAVYECGCTEMPEGDCDCEGNVEDACGECGGAGECEGCMDVSAHNYDPDAMIDDGTFCIYGPDIISIYDAPNDQGGLVYLNWSANTEDTPPNQVITRYSVWRYLPDEGRGWQLLEYVDAYYFETYGVVAPTHGDSTSTGIPWTTYKVLAHTEDQWTFYESQPDSGYSVDNLAPDQVYDVFSEVIGVDVLLAWQESSAADFSHYNLYLNGQLINTSDSPLYYHDTPPYAQDLLYQISAFDIHENESILSEPVFEFILLQGDVNLDANVNVIDIVTLTQYILEEITLNDIQHSAADMNMDGGLDVIDIVMIVDEILGISLSRTEGLEDITLKYGNGIFSLEFEKVIAGIQCDVSGDFEIRNIFVNEGWKLHENGKTLLLYAEDGSDLSTSRPFEYGGDLQVNSCMATDWFFEPTMVDVVELPKAYSLHSAYPNPFNPTTRIDFDLPVDSHVSMTVYNLQGRLLTTLSDEIKSAGYHSISWNASQYSSGVYFVSIYAYNTDVSTVESEIKQSFTKTQKLMLVK